MTKLLNGATFLIRGLGLLNKSGVRRWVIIPLIINTVLFISLFALGASWVSDVIDQTIAKLPEWVQWISWLIWLVFAIVAGLIGFFLFSVFANIIAAPFNAYLSEAVEKYLVEADGLTYEPPKSDMGFIETAKHSVMNELRKAGYFLMLAIPVLLLFIVPGINILAPILWFLFSAWMLALEYICYPSDNHEWKFKTIRASMREKRWGTLVFGGTISLAMMVPLINLLIMPASVAGATLYWHRELRSFEALPKAS